MRRPGLAAWGLRELILDEQLALTRRVGADLLELSIDNTPRDALRPGADASAIRRVREAFAASGVRLVCGCTGSDFTAGDPAREVERVCEIIRIAGALDLQVLRIFAGFASDSAVTAEAFEQVLKALTAVRECADREELVLCVETHGGVRVEADGALTHFHSLTTRTDCWRKILQTGVAMTYDPANLAAAGVPEPEAFYCLFREHVRYIHLKDFRDVPGGVAPAACGEGRLDWQALKAALRDYDGPAVIEYEIPDDVEDGMRRSLAFLDRIGMIS